MASSSCPAMGVEGQGQLPVGRFGTGVWTRRQADRRADSALPGRMQSELVPGAGRRLGAKWGYLGGPQLKPVLHN